VRRFAIALGSLLLAAAGATHAGACTYAPPARSGLDALPRQDEPARDRHAQNLARTRQGGVGLLFVGDSITQGWTVRAASLWRERFGVHQPANFGISGDRVEHLAWRLQHGELDGLQPRAVVLLIGANNVPTGRPDRLAAAIRSTAQLVRCKLPQAQVLIVGVLPRGERTTGDGQVVSEARYAENIGEMNRELALADNDEQLHFVDAGARFRGADGKVDRALMPDGLHLSAEGYRVLADAIEPALRTLLHRPAAAARGREAGGRPAPPAGKPESVR
jgi:lysophospholipase L1-like esterase